ncbi:hypothetical protein M2302_004529 [Micromonospora sp. A200]|uniref:hypothetical protein n=1 Tax=Micromonospora sp. A200 TaxID=2940568 RepID=UPI0024731CD6|nr:hypothetical protein [Micromonospora sp. A200]MDH6464331.1 hypothetical protein [Micromonospora sp. A200]
MTDPTAGMPLDQPLPPPASPPAVPAVDGGPAPHESTETAAAEHKRGRRTLALVSAAGAAALLLVFVGVIAATRGDETQSGPTDTKTPFVAAKERCGSASAGGAELGDQGKTLTLHGAGKESSGLSYSMLECYWSALDMSDAVKAEVGATRALDGRQTGDWGDIHASWSYHPDSGLQMVLTLSD